ncbi:MAG: hypothetical protein JO362_14735 [Streptomycetaceae bacterium]|nr:hypothetical protein [Streptomycetaceae bacterium]
MTHLDPATAAEVFAAARTASFRTTNLGLMADVSVGGYSYRVIVEPHHLAHIDCRFGWGGTEWTFASATVEQDRALRHALTQARPSPSAVGPAPHRRQPPAPLQRQEGPTR